jgi:hypothetical protein
MISEAGVMLWMLLDVLFAFSYCLMFHKDMESFVVISVTALITTAILTFFLGRYINV